MLLKLFPFTGINKDLSVNDLPVGSVSDASNVRFREGMAELFLGEIDAYPTAPIGPVSAFPLRIADDFYWIVFSLTKGYCVTGSPAVWTNITRQTAGTDVNYAATLDLCWNGGVLNGVPILNNGVDVPQMWSPIGPATKLQALTAWPAATTAKVLRPYSNYVFALDVTQSGTRFPHRVLWSGVAEPGTVPTTWDVSDDEQDAGQFDLTGSGFVIDCLGLRQSLIIYKQNSTHVASFVGGTYIWNFTQLFASSGMLSPDCAVEVDGTHVVLTPSDVIRHDGSSINSVLDKVTRRWLFQHIDSTQYDRCFVTKNVYFNEVWICYCSLGATSCDMALVYNYKDGTTSFRQLPNVTSGNTGLIDQDAEGTFDGPSIPFVDDTAAFNENEFGATLDRTLLCSPSLPALVLADSGNTFFDDLITGTMERVGLSFDAPNQVKTLSRLRPRFKAPTGTVITFQVGGSMYETEGYTWSSPITFTVGVDSAVNAFASGYFLAYRITSSTAYAWRLDGMDMDFTPRGSY